MKAFFFVEKIVLRFPDTGIGNDGDADDDDITMTTMTIMMMRIRICGISDSRVNCGTLFTIITTAIPDLV